MTYAIQGETGDWEVVIGLEVRRQVVSKAKLFSGAATDFKNRTRRSSWTPPCRECFRGERVLHRTGGSYDWA